MNDRPKVTITRRGNWADVVTSFTPGAPMPPDGEYELRRRGESLARNPAAVERGIQWLTENQPRELVSNMDIVVGVLRAAERDD